MALLNKKLLAAMGKIRELDESSEDGEFLTWRLQKFAEKNDLMDELISHLSVTSHTIYADRYPTILSIYNEYMDVKKKSLEIPLVWQERVDDVESFLASLSTEKGPPEAESDPPPFPEDYDPEKDETEYFESEYHSEAGIFYGEGQHNAKEIAAMIGCRDEKSRLAFAFLGELWWSFDFEKTTIDLEMADRCLSEESRAV